MIHTTIGIYPNGPSKFNGVKPEHLADHIEYNRTNRPGRALMVDGELVLEGYGYGNQVDKELLAELATRKIDECTAPYQ